MGDIGEERGERIFEQLFESDRTFDLGLVKSAKGKQTRREMHARAKRSPRGRPARLALRIYRRLLFEDVSRNASTHSVSDGPCITAIGDSDPASARNHRPAKPQNFRTRVFGNAEGEAKLT